MSRPKQVAVLGSFLTSPQSFDFALAEELGFLLAKNGFHVLCGGHGGIAHPLVSGVTRAGGVVRGISMEEAGFPGRSARMDPRITEVVNVHSVAERLQTLAEADGFIFFTGGIGTLCEYFFIWHSLQVAGDFARPLIFISTGWDHLLDVLRQEQMIKHKYFRMVHLCGRARDAVAILAKDYSLKYDPPGGIFIKRAISFDLDGILVESPEEAFTSLCENRGYFFCTGKLKAAFRRAECLRFSPGDALPRLRVLLEALGIAAGTAADIAAALSEEFNRPPELNEDVVDTLHDFKERGFLMGVLSFRRLSEVQDILSAHSLSALFDFVGILKPPLEKPLTRSLEDVFAASGVAKKGIVHIADYFSQSSSGCRAIGVESILLDRYLSHTACDGTFSVRSPADLKYLLKLDRAA